METFKEIQNLCIIIGAWMLGIAFMIYPFLYFSITVKFNKLFNKKRDDAGLFHPGIIFFNGIEHTSVYVTCIVFSKRIKNPNAHVSFNYNRFFDNYDFRAHVNGIELFLCRLYLFLVLGSVSIGFVGFAPNIIPGIIIWFKAVYSLF